MTINYSALSLRNTLQYIPPDALAIIIPKSQFAFEVQRRIVALANSKIQFIKTSIEDLDVGFEIKSQSVLVKFDNISGHISVSFNGTLFFTPSNDTSTYRTRPLIVTDAQFSLISDESLPQGMGFQFENAVTIKVERPTQNVNPDLIKKHYNGDEFQYRVDEAAVCLSTPAVLNQALVRIMSFPNIKGALRTFTLAPQITVNMQSPDYLILYSTPVSLLTACPYVPDTEPRHPSLKSFLTNCGELDSPFDFNYGVIYPKISTLSALVDKIIGLSIEEGAERYTTIDWLRYKLFARVKPGITLDLVDGRSTAEVSLDLSLEGDGEYGPYVSCTNTKGTFLRSNIKSDSSMKVKGSIGLCMDNDNIYLKAMFEAKPDVKFSWEVLGMANSVVDNLVNSTLDGPFGIDVNKKIKGQLQVPLIKRTQWTDIGIQGWKAHIISDVLFIIFTDRLLT